MSETISRVRQLTEKGAKMEGWDDCWKAGLTPWDRGSSLPVLCELCKEDALPKGYALVPGCGRGYDVLTLASESRVAIGLDCSEEAKKQAEQLRDSRGISSERAQFVIGNFFDFPFSQKFDLVYDLTFFCALPPESRSSWATRMKDIIQVGGELVTVIFPIGDYEGGPPYAMSLDLYRQYLEPLGFESFYMKNISDQLPPSSIFVRWKLCHLK
ncbi:Probable thiol methyltransferase 2 [Galdieria sulphuraria]|uniref:Thiopurine S-methyltransferase n=1 Tax=Galdieria sulphuraria TaxID=130081 RepID=M2W4V5_GALSU|nr:thiopurine S-methyltransferase [Galdieria sulphuraria]EME30771.1 thiopurine S-methyltransferase [Galdieria sulphuraria]GJD10844.1 Probable thiol methyltransferase 2 [Galdieria sulphuraria]|eukprot:XP_005707291.1 thiopurine S-methyltransferase [Galdieria sulphuraria]